MSHVLSPGGGGLLLTQLLTFQYNMSDITLNSILPQRQSLIMEQQMSLLSSVIKHATLYNANSSLSIIFRLLCSNEHTKRLRSFNFISIPSLDHYYWRGLGGGWYTHQSIHSLLNFYHCIHTQLCLYTSIKLGYRHALN